MSKENMDVFDQFDEAMDQDGLLADIKAAEEGQGDYKEVPKGTYDVSIDKMELKLSKAGDPMFSAWFKINAGEFKGSFIFMNQVITRGFQIHIVKEFLRSLESGLEVDFLKYKQFAELIDAIREEVKSTKAYGLEYGENNKGYNTFKITQVIDLPEEEEEEEEELPFN